MYVKSKYKEEIYPEYLGKENILFPKYDVKIIFENGNHKISEEIPKNIKPNEYVYKVEKCCFKHKITFDSDKYIIEGGFICVSEEKTNKINFSLEDITEKLEYDEDFVRRDGWRDEKQKIFELDDSFLLNSYNKFMPKLTFLVDKNFYPKWEVDDYLEVLRKKLELEEWKGTSIDCVFGNYFISKKGVKCFKILPKEKAKHVLIRNKWGGDTRNINKRHYLTSSEAKNNLYHIVSRSHGGSLGRTYAIFNLDRKDV